VAEGFRVVILVEHDGVAIFSVLDRLAPSFHQELTLPCEGTSHPPAHEARALLTLNALGPKPGSSAAILAKTFRLTPSEAKVACIIARGAPPDIAARELKISRETARNQLKSVFAKTDTHRQSELVALLLQVE
jgi:DNA-binding CsgD family transcriptional regulator